MPVLGPLGFVQGLGGGCKNQKMQIPPASSRLVFAPDVGIEAVGIVVTPHPKGVLVEASATHFDAIM